MESAMMSARSRGGKSPCVRASPQQVLVWIFHLARAENPPQVPVRQREVAVGFDRPHVVPNGGVPHRAAIKLLASQERPHRRRRTGPERARCWSPDSLRASHLLQ